MSRPILSIIATHFEESATEEQFHRFIDSVNQPGDFEVLIYHDGPVKKQKLNIPKGIKFTATDKRYNDWGHSLRDMGIREAKGRYLLFTNCDNVIYPILDSFTKAIAIDTAPVYICPIVMVGVVQGEKYGKSQMFRTFKPEDRLLLPGEVEYGLIDCMQFIMKRKLWLRYGGWYNKHKNSDGIMYKQFAKKHTPTYIDTLLGEHW